MLADIDRLALAEQPPGPASCTLSFTQGSHIAAAGPRPQRPETAARHVLSRLLLPIRFPVT